MSELISLKEFLKPRLTPVMSNVVPLLSQFSVECDEVFFMNNDSIKMKNIFVIWIRGVLAFQMLFLLLTAFDELMESRETKKRYKRKIVTNAMGELH